MENVNRLLAELVRAHEQAQANEQQLLKEREAAEEKHAAAMLLLNNLESAIDALTDLRDGRESKRDY